MEKFQLLMTILKINLSKHYHGEEKLCTIRRQKKRKNHDVHTNNIWLRVLFEEC